MPFKATFFLWPILFFLSFHAQAQVEVELATNGPVAYLTIANPNGHPFLDSLNTTYGLAHMRKQIILESINEYTANDLAGMSGAEVDQLIAQREIGLAAIDLEIPWNGQGLLVINRHIAREGTHKVTNSLHSEYPETLPAIIDIATATTITELETLFTAAGLQYLQQTAQQELQLRSKTYCKEGPYDCRIGNGGICAVATQALQISNQDPNPKNGIAFHFYLEGAFLVLESNELNHECLICADPSSALRIPLADMANFLQPAYHTRLSPAFLQSVITENNRSFIIGNQSISIFPLPENPFGHNLNDGDDQHAWFPDYVPHLQPAEEIRLLYSLGKYTRVQRKDDTPKMGWVLTTLLK